MKEYDKSIFSISPRSIKVVFPYPEEQKVEGKVEGKVAREFSATQLKIVNAMKEDPMITAAKLAKQFGIRKNIAKLKEARVIERLGSDKTGSWKVNE